MTEMEELERVKMVRQQPGVGTVPKISGWKFWLILEAWVHNNETLRDVKLRVLLRAVIPVNSVFKTMMEEKHEIKINPLIDRIKTLNLI